MKKALAATPFGGGDTVTVKVRLARAHPLSALGLLPTATKLSCPTQGPELWTLQGDRFATGLGVVASPELAAREYWRAANAGFAPAMSRLASCYEAGRGVANKSLGDALLWYRKAAGHQDADALDAMGRAYEAGTWPSIPQVRPTSRERTLPFCRCSVRLLSCGQLMWVSGRQRLKGREGSAQTT